MPSQMWCSVMAVNLSRFVAVALKILDEDIVDRGAPL